MRYYAIKHKPTGKFLPLNGNKARGFTYVEPVDPCHMPPRLFTSPSSARCALRWWLGGTALTDYDSDYGHYLVGQKVQSGRLEHEMEVVPISLSV